ncbi:MAG TPA: peptide-methionine (R)-S-oxide reductase MsrB [Rhizomicrobium sp.]|jgi:peptide-methionine (R)-S-oxide reductase|nr:peptide-methionine (R)-S-oxide reductase MsrB [Rhizomicrobium sp.]
MQRRNFIGLLLMGSASTAVSVMIGDLPAFAAAYRVTKSDADWKKTLPPASYDVLRHQGTEMPYSSPLDMNYKKGTYHCLGCDQPLYSSDTKYDSRTGWPSFWKPLPNAIVTGDDRSLDMERTEVHCVSCGGHLGHVFDDGPRPTGLRYCMNGVALRFQAA